MDRYFEQTSQFTRRLGNVPLKIIPDITYILTSNIHNYYKDKRLKDKSNQSYIVTNIETQQTMNDFVKYTV